MFQSFVLLQHFVQVLLLFAPNREFWKEIEASQGIIFVVCRGMIKKWTLAISIGAVFIILSYRLFNKHVAGVASEKQWYVEQLNFKFSGVIDTVNRPGHILFSITHGSLDRLQEGRLNSSLKRNGVLDLFLYKPDEMVELMIPHANRFIAGDSIYVNSSLNIVKVYRGDSLLLQHPLVPLLRGRPF